MVDRITRDGFVVASGYPYIRFVNDLHGYEREFADAPQHDLPSIYLQIVPLA